MSVTVHGLRWADGIDIDSGGGLGRYMCYHMSYASMMYSDSYATCTRLSIQSSSLD